MLQSSFGDFFFFVGPRMYDYGCIFLKIDFPIMLLDSFLSVRCVLPTFVVHCFRRSFVGNGKAITVTCILWTIGSANGSKWNFRCSYRLHLDNLQRGHHSSSHSVMCLGNVLQRLLRVSNIRHTANIQKGFYNRFTVIACSRNIQNCSRVTPSCPLF